jgi:Protein of unknown function (DUF3303)
MDHDMQTSPIAAQRIGQLPARSNAAHAHPDGPDSLERPRFHDKDVSMRYMVIERYLSGPGPVYERAAARGRMLPEGLVYVNSWVVADGGMDRCFQLMETSDPALFDVWFERWSDLVSFELYPVITSAEAAERHS